MNTLCDIPRYVSRVFIIHNRSVTGDNQLTHLIRSLHACQILDHFVLPSKLADDMAIFALLEQPLSVHGGQGDAAPMVHAIQMEQRSAENLNKLLAQRVAQLPPSFTQAATSGSRKVRRPAVDDNSTVTIGIGLHRTSDLKIASELTRAGSIKLKGRHGRRSIRRDHKYGDTFASLQRPTAVTGRSVSTSTADGEDSMTSGADGTPRGRTDSWKDMVRFVCVFSRPSRVCVCVCVCVCV